MHLLELAPPQWLQEHQLAFAKPARVHADSLQCDASDPFIPLSVHLICLNKAFTG